MFALPNLSIGLLPLIVVAIGLAAMVAFSVFRTVVTRFREPSHPDSQGGPDVRKCKYCRRGVAMLREETVRLDGDDLVDVRCYVCTGCGLPQWWVERRGISPHVR